MRSPEFQPVGLDLTENIQRGLSVGEGLWLWRYSARYRASLPQHLQTGERKCGGVQNTSDAEFWCYRGLHHGEVTISPAPTTEVIRGGCYFDIPCRFNSQIEVSAISADLRDCGVLI